MSEQTDTAQDLNKAKTLLEGMLQHMDIDATVSGDELNDKLQLNIDCTEEEDTQRPDVSGRQ